MPARKTLKYQADSSEIHGLLLDPDRAAKAGTEPTGDVSSNIKCKVSKGNKEFGLRPRGVRLARIVGTDPDTFRKYSFLPVLTAAAFGSATFAVGATITIGGVDWEVAAKVAEDY